MQARVALLDWYDHNHRVMPWRRTPHTKRGAAAESGGEGGSVKPAPASLPQQQFAYYVWVSEVMLQQTQVSRAAATRAATGGGSDTLHVPS